MTRQLRMAAAPVAAAGVAVLLTASTAYPAAQFPAQLLAVAVFLGAAAYVAWFLDPAYLLCAGLATMVFSGNWRYFGWPDGVAPDRLFVLAAIGLAVVRAPGARDRPPFRLTWPHLLLALASLWVVVSAAWAGTLGDSGAIFRMTDRLGFIPFLLLAATPLVIWNDRHRQALLVTLVVLGGYLAIVGILQGAGAEQLVFPASSPTRRSGRTPAAGAGRSWRRKPRASR